MDEVDNFLAHYGVKGMQWGKTKVRPTSSTSYKLPSKDTVKKVTNEVFFGAMGPAAVLAGLGPPITLAIGFSAALLSKPPVRNAIAATTVKSASLMKEIGDTKISAMKQTRELKKELQDKMVDSSKMVTNKGR